MPETAPYAARFDVDYPESLDRLTTFFRLFWAIPILILFGIIASGGQSETYGAVRDGGEVAQTVRSAGIGIAAQLTIATALMIAFRKRYPRWWFDFQLELARFGSRVGAYLSLLTDVYPSTVEAQSVHLDVDYPNVEQDLNPWLALVKWLLAIPHYIAIAFLSIGSVVAVIIAWFAILFTGRYPRALFDYNVGVMRWWTRVNAYAFLLVTDEYPPFSLR
ncbi:MAG: DUF4389 domain-containing protein [Ardenticatenales bacterium]